jgi:alpha-glucosidase
MHDHGYDVPSTTTSTRCSGPRAFDRLLEDAHAAGLQVIVDVVPEPHVERARVVPGGAGRPVVAGAGPLPVPRRRGATATSRPNNWRSVFGGPAWTRESPTGQWYLHLFDSSQPDLDWQNREVHDELQRVLRFWLDRGVDGFRIDVAHLLYKDPAFADLPPGRYDDRRIGDQDEVLAVYEQWRRLLDSYDGDRMMVGEVFLFDVPRIARYVSDTRLHQAFNFTSWPRPGVLPALRRRSRRRCSTSRRARGCCPTTT